MRLDHVQQARTQITMPTRVPNAITDTQGLICGLSRNPNSACNSQAELGDNYPSNTLYIIFIPSSSANISRHLPPYTSIHKIYIMVSIQCWVLQPTIQHINFYQKQPDPGLKYTEMYRHGTYPGLPGSVPQIPYSIHMLTTLGRDLLGQGKRIVGQLGALV